MTGWRSTAALLMAAGVALAQTGSRGPSFEAASVKPVDQGRPGMGSLRGGPGTASPGQISGAASLKALIVRAYELKAYQVAGPAWMDSERYEIVAKVPDGATRGQVALMWQALLAERFHLAAHKETRELPILALVVGKSGPRFKPSPAGQNAAADDGTLPPGSAPKLSRAPDGFPDMPAGANLPRSYEAVTGGPDGILYKLWARRETMQQLADRLSGQLNRAVVNRTELQEQYDFALAWTMENAGGGVPRTDPPPDEIDWHNTPVMSDPGLSIFTAVEAQLGLKLERRKGPLEMLVVDAVDKVPTGN